MSTPPQPPPPSYQRPYYGPLPPLPFVNGELVVFVLVWGVVGIITLASDTVDASGFVTASVVLAVGYMISRGIAKASRVYEGR